jgi:hypothetical protein
LSGDLGEIRMQELALFTLEESREYLRTKEVDHLPLALELVVSYMQEMRQSPSAWLEEWRQTQAPTLDFHDADAVNYRVSLALVSEKSVKRLSPTARNHLHVLAWMAPRPAAVPLEAFKASEDWLGLRKALSELAKASLIGWPPAADEISIHRVLQAVTRNHLSEQEKTASLDGALTEPPPIWRTRELKVK